MPSDLGGARGTVVSCDGVLRDGHTLLRGRETESTSVLWARIHHNLHRFPVIDQFGGKTISSGATKDMLERPMQIPARSPLAQTRELSRELECKGKSQTVRSLFAGGWLFRCAGH